MRYIMLSALTFGIFFFFVTAQLRAQSEKGGPVSFSLEAAIEYALKNTPEIKNAGLNIAYANKDVKEILAGGLPQVNGRINFTNYLGIPVNIIQVPNPQTGELQQQEFKFGTDYTMSAGVSASQMLYNPSFFIGLKASQLYVELQNKELDKSEKEAKEAVTKAYYAALISSENLSIIEKNIELVSKILFETKELYKNGFVEQIEVDRLELSINNLTTQYNNLQRQAYLMKNLLKFQMGYPVQDSIVLTDNISNLQVGAEELLSIKFDYLEREEYEILDLQKRLTDLNIRNIKSGYQPNASLFGSYERSAMRDEFNFFDFDQTWYEAAYWGLTINIPLFDSFKKNAQISQEQINYQKLENLQFQLKNALFLEVIQAKTNFENALAQLENQQKNLNLAQKIYNTAIIKYNSGVGSSLEVNNSETTLFQTQSNYINALYDLLIAKTDLQRALGKI